MIHEIRESLHSLRFFFKTIYEHRWWDYYFFQILLDAQLHFMEIHYGKDSHFVGDKFTKGRIIVLRKFLKDWIECDDLDESDESEKSNSDCKNKRKKFFRYFERNFEKFWD
jgi:hypothetical protein